MTRTGAGASKRQRTSTGKARLLAVAQRWLLASFMLVGFVTGSSCFAQAANGISASAVQRAQQFMLTPNRGQEIFGFLHFGVGYRDYTYVTGETLTNGGFELEYSFLWNTDDQDHTEVWFVFTPAGTFDHLRVAYSTAKLNQPFFVADLSISVFGNLLLHEYKDRLSDLDRRFLQSLVDHEDSKGLLEWELRADQYLGK